MKLAKTYRRVAYGGVLLVLVAVIVFGVRQRGAQTRFVGPLPDQLSDTAFWSIVENFSEEPGFFRSDNFISNERMFQYVVNDLHKTFAPGGVYLGVGPDQNFTYIVALQPKIAFIVDIRRQAVMQHLMYKALIEMSADRAEFLSRLFSRPRPPGLDSASTSEQLFGAYQTEEPLDSLYQLTLAAMKERLTKTHGFRLSNDDLKSIGYVFSAFYAVGPDITYSYPNRGGGGGARGGGGRGRGPSVGFGGRGMPNYRDLMVATDENGLNQSYLGSEANFQILKDIQTRNLLVPVVGDFAGKKALRSVGNYVRQHGAVLSAFYTSNVEQYLFQVPANWKNFFENVATFPIDSKSTFIRALPSAGRGADATRWRLTMLDPIGEEVEAFRAGEIRTYPDVTNRSK